MSRKRLTMNFLNNNFKDVMQSIEAGNIYVCRYHDGFCVFVGKEKGSSKYQFIMYSPMSVVAEKTKLTKQQFKISFEKVLTCMSNEHYEFEVDAEFNLIEQYRNIANALMAFEKGSFRNYKVRKLS